MIRPFRMFDILAVYSVHLACYAYDGGETTAKNADINT